MSYDRGDVVVAPFRFTDVDGYKTRPVLVISNAAVFGASGHVIAAMITGASRSSWPLDVRIEDWRTAGLAKPCLVRMKLATIAVETIEAHLGRVNDQTMGASQSNIDAVLGSGANSRSGGRAARLRSKAR